MTQRSAAPPGDGLGYHVLGFDKKTGDRLEMLRVRPQFCGNAAFETALRKRFRHLGVFDDRAFARVRQIDRLDGPTPSLVIVSQHVLGVRLGEVLPVAESLDIRLDIGTALSLIRQLTAAIATLHSAGDGDDDGGDDYISHGCIGPERLLLTADGRLIVTEYILGSALQAMDWSREKFWYEARIALPATGELAAFDRQADIMQIGLLALALLGGRSVYAERRYPLPLAQHVAAASEIPLEGPPRRLAPALNEWLVRALQRDRVSAFTTIEDTLATLDRVIEEGRYDARPSTVAAFVARCRQASPDLKPREPDTPRDTERPQHSMPGAITAIHVPRVSAPIGGATLPPPPVAGVSLPVPSTLRPALTPAINGSATELHAPLHTPLPVDGGSESIEFVIADDEDDLPFEPVDVAPVARAEFAEGPAEENSVLDMELFVGMVHQQKRGFVVHVDKLPLLLVDPMRRAYWLLPGAYAGVVVNGGTPAHMGTGTPEAPSIGDVVARLRRGSLRYRDARADDPPPEAGFPIELLLWNLGMVLQPDELLPQVTARGWVQLTRWPDFGRLRSNPAQLKMSALLTSRAVAVDEVFDIVSESRPSVIAFLNACALSGLLADAPAEAPAPSVGHLAREGRSLGGLMQRLRGALGIGRA
jgi:hypothetical protein